MTCGVFDSSVLSLVASGVNDYSDSPTSYIGSAFVSSSVYSGAVRISVCSFVESVHS